jgi:tRNA uridine 5-carboxymethylaminomethyl modification enzyme
MKKKFDVIVIGAGNAGLEAATVSARMGLNTCLVTPLLDNIGELSCNPSIGGIGKGTLIREIDAMDGVIAKIADFACIHKKNLNASKGPAVWGPRVQIDRKLYKQKAQEIILNYPNLTVEFQMASSLIVEDAVVKGLELENGEKIEAKSVVITTGTFLNGKIIIGEERTPAGRIGEKPSLKLANWIKEYGFEPSRLKTGTPARLHKNSIDWSVMEIQEADDMKPLSYMDKQITNPQLHCYLTYTNPTSHKIIMDNKDKSCVANGTLDAKGPRYCPSIEQKIIRFDRQRHQVFLEPEGYDSDLIYPNGLSTAMPADVQLEFLRSIKGLENVEMVRAGYTIEYMYIDPKKCKPTLETKAIKGLFLAGQIIGTTGYEEAASLGIVAGINAGLYAKQEGGEFILPRYSSLIGVMVDDLVNIGVDGEPYRMFTSRSEYRLSVRSDNADARLTLLAHEFGVISDERLQFFKAKLDKINSLKNKLLSIEFTPDELMKKIDISVNRDGIRRNLLVWLENRNITQEVIKMLLDLNETETEILEYIDIECKYSPYVKRQEEEVEEMKKYMDLKIPKDFDYARIGSFSAEVIEKLQKFQPTDIYQASRISGITPSSISTLILRLKT